MGNQTKRGLRLGALAVVASAGVHWAAAQNERLTVEVGECVDLPTPERRLACFEAQVEAARAREAASAAPAPPAAAPPANRPAAPPQNAAPPARAAAPAPAAAPAATETPDDFGFRERRRAEAAAAPPPEIRGKIAELRETVPNAFLITLDNGQVWRQTRPDPYVTMKVGYDVSIGFVRRFRAYRLTSPDMPGFVQVERVR